MTVYDRIKIIAGIKGVGNVDRLNKAQNISKIASRLNRFTPSDLNLSQKAHGKFEIDPIDQRLAEDEYYATLERLTSNIKKSGVKPFYRNVEPVFQRERLRNLARADEIRDVITKLADECVVPSDDFSKFGEILVNTDRLIELGLNKDEIETITKLAEDSFAKNYRLLGFLFDGAWKKMIKFLIDGDIIFEVLFDDPDNPKHIIGFVEGDPIKFQEIYMEGTKMWIHEKESHARFLGNVSPAQQYQRIILHDWQITRATWGEIDVYGFQSYVAQLMRSYNVMRIVEEAKIIYTVTNATMRTLYKVPTKGKSRTRAAQTVAQEMQRYLDEFEFDNSSGELLVNDRPNIPFQKTHFMAEGDSGSPEISSFGNDGPNLQDMSMNEYFGKKFNKASGVSPSRFDESGETWNLDPTSAQRAEISMGRMVSRIRMAFGKLILKAVLIEMALENPKLRNLQELMLGECITINWNSYNVFQEMMEMDIDAKRIEHLKLWMEVGHTDENGNIIPVVPINSLMKKIFKWTDEDLKLNAKLRKQEIEETVELRGEKHDLEDEAGLLDDLEQQNPQKMNNQNTGF